jgi:hypothetical protein
MFASPYQHILFGMPALFIHEFVHPDHFNFHTFALSPQTYAKTQKLFSTPDAVDYYSINNRLPYLRAERVCV